MGTIPSEKTRHAPVHGLGSVLFTPDAAFVYGSVAKGTDKAASDIELIVVADELDYAAVFSALQTVETELGRTVNPNVITRAEWLRKRKQAGFVARVASQPRLFVIGSDDDLV